MSKKTSLKKKRLGKKLKQNRRIPLVATLRTHRKLQSNAFSRNWRSKKLKLKEK
ncbi:MAG: 50S ribosomal protein L39e [Candidatus Marsarchaeota archaeon]|nr:50S ribosomal protein L39e [Candidatus Marsarchaeota archaeon]MCL5106299.1 50S ribosomal protein L39e [Candidatus Marsarchaeota archaeon]